MRVTERRLFDGTNLFARAAQILIGFVLLSHPGVGYCFSHVLSPANPSSNDDIHLIVEATDAIYAPLGVSVQRNGQVINITFSVNDVAVPPPPTPTPYAQAYDVGVLPPGRYTINYFVQAPVAVLVETAVLDVAVGAPQPAPGLSLLESVVLVLSLVGIGALNLGWPRIRARGK